MKIIKVRTKNGIVDYNEKLKVRQIDEVYFICEKCKKETFRQFRRFNEEYCYCNDCIKKVKSLEKYGTENPFASKEIKDKIKQTSLEKYGVEHPNQNKENYEKIRQTNLRKYGKVAYSQTEEYKSKVRKHSPEEKEEISKKIKETCQEKYGTDNVFSVKEFQEKQKQTLIKNYNIEYPLQKKEFAEKAKQTNIERYGENYAQEITKETSYNRVKERLKEYVIPQFSLEDYEGVEKTYSWKCAKCGEIFEDNADNGRVPRCKKCYPVSYEEGPQKEINDFIENLGFKTLTNKRNIIPPYEIDIFIPEKNIAIEYHGLYWHSEQRLKDRDGKNYHLNKLKLAQQNNIRLIQIFEDEFLNKKEIVLNRIKHMLGIYERKIGGRQTTIKEISLKEKREFFNSYHIQGDDNSSIKLGAFYKNELISVMTFGKKRVALGNKKQGFELLRFATKEGVLGQGIASKLLHYFIENYNPESIITYSDKRWNLGNLYKQLGFEYSHTSSPNYWYVINKERKHRFGYRKQELSKRLKTFNPKLTEYENMQVNGYDRIWDCGNDVFILDK